MKKKLVISQNSTIVYFVNLKHIISEIKISKSKRAYYLRTYDISYKEEIFLINQETIEGFGIDLSMTCS